MQYYTETGLWTTFSHPTIYSTLYWIKKLQICSNYTVEVLFWSLNTDDWICLKKTVWKCDWKQVYKNYNGKVVPNKNHLNKGNFVQIFHWVALLLWSQYLISLSKLSIRVLLGISMAYRVEIRFNPRHIIVLRVLTYLFQSLKRLFLPVILLSQLK